MIICHPDPYLGVAPGEPPRKPVMLIIDSLHSLGSKDRHNFTCDLLGRWLETEYFDRMDGKMQQYGERDCKRVVARSPQQQNGVDCGVFMYNAVVYFVREKARFAELGQTSARTITKPALEKWFPHGDVAIEQTRLKMLDCYYYVASIQKLFGRYSIFVFLFL